MGRRCRICGAPLTNIDLQDAVFAGYSDDKTSRAAHGLCWRNFVDVAQRAYDGGVLGTLIDREIPDLQDGHH